MLRSQVLTNPRMAGGVKRYHTWPTHQVQTVADHTWQVMRIYWTVFGPMPPHISTAILWHDCGELVSGDPPYPVKLLNPVLKHEMDRIEGDAVKNMGGPKVGFGELSVRERIRIKACDLVEMLEFGMEELRLGSQYASPIVDDISNNLVKLDLPHEDRKALASYCGKLGVVIYWTTDKPGGEV